jgi:chlorite dismutase
MTTLVGEALPTVNYLDVYTTHTPPLAAEYPAWCLKGTNVAARYTERAELTGLAARQATLNRPEATCAALIPIKKSLEWWNLAQDERRNVFEKESRHIGMSMEYLPAVARRLYHSRELGEPFDFLTWFEYAPENEHLFDDLVKKLRSTREWEFVDREVDIRLVLEKRVDE